MLKKFQKEWPMLRPLILFLKYFLKCRNMNDTYTGGIGSFLLCMMVVTLLKTHPARSLKHNYKKVLGELNLGVWLISFFQLYGYQLNYSYVGINANCEFIEKEYLKRQQMNKRRWKMGADLIRTR